MMYVHKEYAKYTVLRGTSNNHEILANIISTGSEGIWRWRKMVPRVWHYSWRRVEVFSDGGGIGMVVIEIDYVYRSKCKSRYLFSCQYLDYISNALFSRVYFDG